MRANPSTPTVPAPPPPYFFSPARGLFRADASPGITCLVSTRACPHCRHVVVVDDDAQADLRCANCGARISDAAPTIAPAVSPAPAAPVPAPAAPSPPDRFQAPSPDRAPLDALAIPALVCGLLPFVPIVTQFLAIVFGITSIVRGRKGDRRTGAAWAGVFLGLAAGSLWALVLTTLYANYSAGRRAYMPPAPPWALTGPMAEGEELKALSLSEKLTVLRGAAKRYRRDFGHYPASLDLLLGHSLPADYEIGEDICYIPVPEGEETDPRRIVIVSGVVLYNRQQERLRHPHRVVCRLDGTVEVLPETELAEELAQCGPSGCVGDDP